ncbi:MAG: hypothetical protein ACRDGQ_08750 [Candidatus Limnocylindrales bacterium]
MRTPDRLRAIVEQWLPWYDPAEAARHRRRLDALVLRSKRNRERAEAARAAYQRASERLGRGR